MINKLILLIVCLFLAFIYAQIKKHNNKISRFFLIFISIILSLIFAYREFIFPELMGYDYHDYIKWFENISFNNIPIKFQNIGFNILISICKLISTDYHVFLFVCSFIIIYLFLNFIEEHSNDFILSFMIYITLFYFSAFNGMRQFIACSIFLNSFKYIKEKRLIKYLISVIIAATFHDSALVLIILYPLLNIKNNSKYKEFLFLILGIAAFVFFDSVLSFMMNTSELFGFGYMTKYKSVEQGYEIGNITNLLITIGTYFLIKLKNNTNEAKNKKSENNLFINYLMVAMVFSLLLTTNFVFNRLSIYFLPSIIICIPIAGNLFSNRDRIIFDISVLLLTTYSFLF